MATWRTPGIPEVLRSEQENSERESSEDERT